MFPELCERGAVTPNEVIVQRYCHVPVEAVATEVQTYTEEVCVLK